MSGLGEIGGLCQKAAPLVSMVCPWVGAAMGIGGTIATAVDSKDSDKNQAVEKNDSGLGLGNLLSGSEGSSNPLGVDPTKFVSIFN